MREVPVPQVQPVVERDPAPAQYMQAPIVENTAPQFMQAPLIDSIAPQYMYMEAPMMTMSAAAPQTYEPVYGGFETYSPQYMQAPMMSMAAPQAYGAGYGGFEIYTPAPMMTMAAPQAYGASFGGYVGGQVTEIYPTIAICWG